MGISRIRGQGHGVIEFDCFLIYFLHAGELLYFGLKRLEAFATLADCADVLSRSAPYYRRSVKAFEQAIDFGCETRVGPGNDRDNLLELVRQLRRRCVDGVL
jgi:hypothetical protein